MNFILKIIAYLLARLCVPNTLQRIRTVSRLYQNLCERTGIEPVFCEVAGIELRSNCYNVLAI